MDSIIIKKEERFTMSRVKVGYNKYHNSIDIRWAENVIFTVDCGQVEDGLELTPEG